jgi:hypothetical protein
MPPIGGHLHFSNRLCKNRIQETFRGGTVMAKAKQEPAETKPSLPITEEEIQIRAYALYLARGGEDGHDLEDWFEAERSLKKERAAA